MSFIFITSQAQVTQKIWESLLNNDRQTALKLANTIKTRKASMEQIV